MAEYNIQMNRYVLASDSYDKLYPKTKTVDVVDQDNNTLDTLLNNKIEPWVSTKSYASGAYCVHNGYLWRNTSGAASTGVEPGTNYNVWNVTYSNRNLLDNPWFTVNQRGQSSYTRSSLNSVIEYSLDRWQFSTWNITSASLTSTDGGVILACTANGAASCLIRQKLESSLVAALRGKQVTLSVSYAIRSRSQSPRIFVNGLNKVLSEEKNYEALTITVPDDATSLNVSVGQNADYAGGGNFDMTIVSVKLELGNISTLANDIAPNYAEELMKCQRYLRPFLLGSWGDVDIKVNFANEKRTILFFGDYIGNKMRTKPSMLCYTGGSVRIVGKNSTGSVVVGGCAASDFVISVSSAADGSYVKVYNDNINSVSSHDELYFPVSIDAIGTDVKLFLTAEL